MPTNEDAKRVVLLKNLAARMEYNDTQGMWKLAGAITKDEYEALRYAIDLLVVETDTCSM